MGTFQINAVKGKNTNYFKKKKKSIIKVFKLSA